MHLSTVHLPSTNVNILCFLVGYLQSADRLYVNKVHDAELASHFTIYHSSNFGYSRFATMEMLDMNERDVCGTYSITVIGPHSPATAEANEMGRLKGFGQEPSNESV